MTKVNKMTISYDDLLRHVNHKIVIETEHIGNVEEGYCDLSVFLKCITCNVLIMTIDNPSINQTYEDTPQCDT